MRKADPVYLADRFGTIRNESSDPTSIVRIWPVAWKSRTLSRAAYLHYALNQVECKGHADGLPIHLSAFGSAEARATFGLNVRRNAHLFENVDEAAKGQHSAFLYDVEMLFEDSRGNLFDERGKLRSLRAIDAWYALFPDGTRRNPSALAKARACLVIAIELVRLGSRKTLRRLGLSN